MARIPVAKRMAEGGLKKLFSGLLGRHKAEEAAPPDAELRASFEQTVIRLQQMVEERSFVDVRFPGRADSVYQSLILKVDPHERYVLIDELFPAHGQYFISPGDEVEISSVRRGVPVRFHSWVKSISIDEIDGLPAYRLALPDSVQARQRRTHFRLALDTDSGVRLRIRGPDGERLLCTVLNLSQNGLGFSCQGNLSESLRESPVLRNCLLSIPGQPEIGCDLEARSFEFRKQPHRHTVVGARIDNLAPASARQLEQYLVLTQRQQRRETVRR